MNCNCKPCLKFVENKCSVKDITIINGKCMNELQDKIKYYQHKYFHGILLPEIAEAMGETSADYVKRFILKPRWIAELTGQPFYTYENYSDIPNKFITNGSSIWQLDESFNNQYAVIPSMSGFTIKEAKSFISYCEKVLFYDLQGCISEKNNDEYKFYRDKLNNY